MGPNWTTLDSRTHGLVHGSDIYDEREVRQKAPFLMNETSGRFEWMGLLGNVRQQDVRTRPTCAGAKQMKKR